LSEVVVLLDILILMKGGKQKNISQVIVHLLPAFDMRLDELRLLIVMRVEFIKKLFHGNLQLHRLFFHFCLFFDRKLREMFLMLMGEGVKGVTAAGCS